MKLLAKILLGLAAVVLSLGIALFLFVPGLHITSLWMILNVMTGSSADTPSDILLDRLQVVNGYSVGIYARGLENPRMLSRPNERHLLVSSPRGGSILLLADNDGDGVMDEQRVLLDGLTRPHGLELYQSWLYVAESNRVGRVEYDAANGNITGDYEPVITGLTDNGNHWSKTIRFDDEGWMYVAMGSTCNVCEEADERRATIMRYRADGSGGEIFASGLRNSVGMDFAPWNGTLYATDNGRDLLGDDYPPCELNHIRQGGFYGWPYLNGNNEPDPDFGAGTEALQNTAVAPAFSFRAHNAPLGIHFVRDAHAPSRLQRSALVALHGSWNRSRPDGYKVVSLHWDEAGGIGSRDFLWGFEKAGEIVGRPVDIVGDGSGGFYISDDYAGVIYRVTTGVTASAAPVNNAPVEYQATDAQLAAAGARLYENLPCGDCHDPGVLTPVPLNRLLDRYDLATLADYFLTPTPPMPRFDLDARQREQLAHYLISRARETQAPVPAER